MDLRAYVADRIEVRQLTSRGDRGACPSGPLHWGTPRICRRICRRLLWLLHPSDLSERPRAIQFDRSGTTRIGKYVINHSFILPGSSACQPPARLGTSSRSVGDWSSALPVRTIRPVQRWRRSRSISATTARGAGCPAADVAGMSDPPIPCCPLPYLPLRNGRLNEMSYSLFQFLRDVTGGDFVTSVLSLDNNPGLIRRTSIPLERAGREAINGNSKL